MNKFIKVLAASALVATALTGCGSKAKYAKVGFGMVTTISMEKVNTTMATVGLDGDGKVVYLDIDCAQQDTKAAGDDLKTKYEKKELYDMKKDSPIKKEWNEQIDAFVAWATGKTLEEIANVKTKDYHGGKAPADADLAAGCTIVIDDMLAAVDKAGKNLAEVEADKIGAGETTSISMEKVNTTTVSVALDADGKVVWSNIDCAQQNTESTGDDLKSKYEKKELYDMKKDSPIKKEWFEQVDAFEAWAKGKTADEVAKVELKDYHGGKAPAGADLSAGCTIVVDDILASYAEAFKLAK